MSSFIKLHSTEQKKPVLINKDTIAQVFPSVFFPTDEKGKAETTLHTGSVIHFIGVPHEYYFLETIKNIEKQLS